MGRGNGGCFLEKRKRMKLSFKSSQSSQLYKLQWNILKSLRITGTRMKMAPGRFASNKGVFGSCCKERRRVEESKNPRACHNGALRRRPLPIRYFPGLKDQYSMKGVSWMLWNTEGCILMSSLDG